MFLNIFLNKNHLNFLEEKHSACRKYIAQQDTLDANDHTNPPERSLYKFLRCSLTQRNTVLRQRSLIKDMLATLSSSPAPPPNPRLLFLALSLSLSSLQSTLYYSLIPNTLQPKH